MKTGRNKAAIAEERIRERKRNSLAQQHPSRSNLKSFVNKFFHVDFFTEKNWLL